MRRLALVLALGIGAPGIAAAKKAAPLFEDKVTADVATVQGGALKTLADATVRLVCVTREPKSNVTRCDSTLRVEKNGKVVATLDQGVFDIEYEAAGGNSADLFLGLVKLDAGGLVAVRSRTREGDESMKEHEEEQLFVVDGATLREVYRWTPLDAYEPGPDGPDSDRKKETAELEPAPGNTLVLREASGETRLLWDGKKFAAPDVEPLVQKVLAGKRVVAAELKSLSDDQLGKLRNAPYARHGRPFKTPGLQAYFYRALKLSQNPAFTEAMLDADDKANLAVIGAEQRARKK